MAKQYVIKDSKGKDRVYTDVDTVTLTDIDGNDVTFTQENVYDVSNAFLVKVIDYDGTVLKSEKLNTGDVFTLPEPQLHDKLTFQEWVAPVDITDNTVTVGENDITIGAIYTTKSGLSEFDITLTKVTGLNVTLNMNGTKDWGDGTSDTSTSHTYADYGDYTIMCDGSSLIELEMFGQSQSNENYYCTAVRLGPNLTTIQDYVFKSCRSLLYVTMSNSVKFNTRNNSYLFADCSKLTAVIFPQKTQYIERQAFENCYSLRDVVFPKGLLSIGEYVFSNVLNLDTVIIPNSVTSVGNYTFQNSKIKYIVFPESVTSVGVGMFSSAYGLQECRLPNSISEIYGNTFSYANALRKIKMPDNLKYIQSQAFNSCYCIKELVMPASLISIAGYVFLNCYSLTKIDFTKHTSVPTLTDSSAFSNINKSCKIYVPDELYDAWISATNWATYADYIYKASEMPVD